MQSYTEALTEHLFQPLKMECLLNEWCLSYPKTGIPGGSHCTEEHYCTTAVKTACRGSVDLDLHADMKSTEALATSDPRHGTELKT